MTGTITYILSRAGYRAMNGPLADERRRLAGAEPPAAYVSYDPRLLAGAGWYGYRIALKGGDRQMTELARYMLSERYVIRDGYEYYSDGVYVFGVLLRERVPHYGIGGGVDWSGWDGLLFTAVGGPAQVGMRVHRQYYPESTASRTIEYSTDGANTWHQFTTSESDVYFCTLQDGQSVAIRGENSFYGYFLNLSSFYGNSFIFTGYVMASGNIKSLTNDSDEITGNGALAYLFRRSGNSLLSAPLFPYKVIPDNGYRAMFYECSNLTIITTEMTDISASNSLYLWTQGVSPTGDFYCPAELTIPTGPDGIPSGWTRHDI